MWCTGWKDDLKNHISAPKHSEEEKAATQRLCAALLWKRKIMVRYVTGAVHLNPLDKHTILVLLLACVL